MYAPPCGVRDSEGPVTVKQTHGHLKGTAFFREDCFSEACARGHDAVMVHIALSEVSQHHVLLAFLIAIRCLRTLWMPRPRERTSVSKMTKVRARRLARRCHCRRPSLCYTAVGIAVGQVGHKTDLKRVLPLFDVSEAPAGVTGAELGRYAVKQVVPAQRRTCPPSSTAAIPKTWRRKPSPSRIAQAVGST
jgi:hypothetical protein